MRPTKSRHHRHDLVTLALGHDDLLRRLDGLCVRISGLYWEETTWGYTLEPTGAVDPDQARLLAQLMFHDEDLAA